MSQRKKMVAKPQTTAKAITTAPKKESVITPRPLPKDKLPNVERIQAYGKHNVEVGQNVIFADNGVDGDLKLTDIGVAELWNKSWPNRKIVAERGGYNARHVVGARRDYNKGTHGKNADGEVIVPKIKCGKWVFNSETHEKKYIEA